MKKNLLMLGLLAVLGLFVSCKSGTDDSSEYIGSGAFTIQERSYVFDDQEYAASNGYPKGDDGKYYYYQYYLIETTKADLSECVDYDIFYKTETGVGNMYKSSCKGKILKMLDEGKYSKYTNNWLNYTPLLLDSYPN